MLNKGILIIILFLLIPNIVTAGNPDPDDPYYDISRIIDAKIYPNPGRELIELAAGSEGYGMYFDFITNSSVNYHILNSSARMAVLESKPWSSVNNYDFMNKTALEFEFINPYTDTFWLLIYNPNPAFVDFQGWYAGDETGPSGEIWGFVDSDKRYHITETINVGCYFDDRFGIYEVSLYADHYFVASEIVDSTGAVNWTIDLDLSALYIAKIDLKFTAVDQVGNSKSYIEEIIVDTLNITNPTTTTITEIPLVILGLLISMPILLGIVMLISSYLQSRKKEIIVDKKKHKDKKGYKRGKWN